MKIKVITAAYNCPKWIFDYLDGWGRSSQKQSQVELMIGVDGCKRTHEALLSHNIPHYWSPENVGTYVMANSLHALSGNADLFIRFDADDVPLPTYLPTAIDNAARSQCFQFLEYITDENLTPIKKHDKSNTIVYTKDVLQKIGGFHSVRVSADKDFIRRAKLAGFTTKNPHGHHFYKRRHKQALTRAKETNMKSAYRKKCEELMRNHAGYYVDPVVVELQRFERQNDHASLRIL